jgi:hypothetical protein
LAAYLIAAPMSQAARQILVAAYVTQNSWDLTPVFAALARSGRNEASGAGLRDATVTKPVERNTRAHPTT